MTAIKSYYVFFWVLVAILFATNRHVTMKEAEEDYSLYNQDSLSYLTIARSAPNFPRIIPENSKKIVFHQAQRFFFPYLVGIAAHATNTSEEKMFFHFNLIFIILTLVVLFKLARINTTNIKDFLILSSVLVLSPYLFRYYITFYGMQHDMAFILGLVFLAYGVQEKQFYTILTGVIVASLARQVTIFYFPAIFLWSFLNKRWREGVVLYATVLLIYFLTSHFAKNISESVVNKSHLIGTYCWVTDFFNQNANCFKTYISPELNDLMVGYNANQEAPKFFEIINFAFRLFIPLLFLFGFVFLLCWKNIRQSLGSFFSVDKNLGIWLLIAAGTIFPAILMGPYVCLTAGTRYSAPLLIPLSMIFQRQLKIYSPFKNFSWIAIFILVLIISLASLNHVLSFLALPSKYASYFAAWHVFCFAICMSICFSKILKE